MARFLVDEDCPRSLAPALNKAGLEALDARDIGLRGASDKEIFKRAVDEGRAIITFDTDFANLFLYPLCHHAGILVGRMPESMVATSRVAQFLKAIDALKDEPLTDTLIIVEPGRIRLRRSGTAE